MSAGDQSRLLEAIERAAVGSWPALETQRIGNWLARFSSGGSIRANSVAALSAAPDDLPRGDAEWAALIAQVAAFYRQRDAVPRFTIVDGCCQPPDLDARLGALGWQRHGDHVTMTKRISAPAHGAFDTVTRLAEPEPEWMSIYLEGLSADRRGIAARLIAGVPGPRAFFVAKAEGRGVGSGLSVRDGDLASVQCMATLPAARRMGAARLVLAAIETWAGETGAERLYLQAELGNTGAIRLYESVGFTIIGHYHTRELRDPTG